MLSNDLNGCQFGQVRKFYRTYLAKYPIFRAVKRVALMAWWLLRNTIITPIRLLGRPRIFYRTYLARYWVFRQLKNLLLLIYFRFPGVFTRFSQLLRRIRTYRLITMQDFVAQQGIKPVLIAPPGRIEIPGPRFIGHYPVELHGGETVVLDMPAIEVAEIPGAAVMGGTNLILCGKSAIHPDLFVPSRDMIPAEIFGVATMDFGRDEISLRIPRRVKRTKRAISLLGQCTGNYAHWLTETLPKLLIVDTLGQFDGLPLLVDEWIHPNFYASIKLFNNGNREMVQVGRWEVLLLPGVVEISPPSYVPYESRRHVEDLEIPVPSPDVFRFSRFALEMLRNAAQGVAQSSMISGSRKLYLRRPPESVGNGRLITNLEEVERLILGYGFEAIDPGKLSIAEQIAVFRDAECIISPVGAALANAIFAPAGCRIIALAPYYENANYYYFSNMMGALGHELHYVLGPQMEMDGHAFHRDYSIDIEALDDALSGLAR